MPLTEIDAARAFVAIAPVVVHMMVTVPGIMIKAPVAFDIFPIVVVIFPVVIAIAITGMPVRRIILMMLCTRGKRTGRRAHGDGHENRQLPISWNRFDAGFMTSCLSPG